MEQCIKLANENGYIAMINIPVWMTLASYANLRKKVIEKTCLINALDLGRGMFGSDYGTISFSLRKTNIIHFKGLYKKFYYRKGDVELENTKKERFIFLIIVSMFVFSFSIIHLYSILSLPIILLTPKNIQKIKVKSIKHINYLVYPLHLLIMFLIRFAIVNVTAQPPPLYQSTVKREIIG